MPEIIRNASKNLQNTAIIANGIGYSYQTLIQKSTPFSAELLAKKNDLNESRVAFMIDPGFEYVVVQWAIWQAGGVAVPLCVSYPLPSLRYVIENTDAEIIVVSPQYEALLSPLALELGKLLITFSTESILTQFPKNLPKIDSGRKAMILFTSGTTNLPKGVVTTHENIEAQISTLIDAWKWTENDHILCVLPLHHVHGIINVVSCALWSGASVEFLSSFSEEAIFQSFNKGKINLFMAVPTIYFKLIAYWEKQDLATQKQITETLSKFRLMVSGSAALPVSVMEKWKIISNHTLLERYGMTEIGMGISNPYDGERKAGYIGIPLPNVEVRLVDENNIIVPANEAGEIQVKGKSVFKEYWNNPGATQKAFTEDGWFKTGDIAVIENGNYRILGRDSIDIIKSGGYKISALEIEEALRTHSLVVDCSVIGIADAEWGELVVAAIVSDEKDINFDELNLFLRKKIPAYKCPRLYKTVNELPRNGMGKVVKNELKQLFIA